MSLNEVWEAAAGNSFYPVVSKERQFTVGFLLLFTGELRYQTFTSSYELTE